ncbi:MAG TPA: hypothetical protein VGW10_03470, partial [Solirubrobacteraceae bacterium]|nr:hypothetical protein [Solirubrobacteraceae bacterium]
MRIGKDTLTLLVAAVLAVALAAGALAQAPGDDAAPTPNTESTPVLRDGEKEGIWAQTAGARFREDASSQTPPALVPGSATPMTVDFYGVEFRDEREGLAVGAACPAGTAYDALELCERHPAIYRYVAPVGEPARWEEMELPGGDERGFVAAVAWIGPGRALAVGGTHDYPAREPGVPIDRPEDDPAGTARAWLLDGGTWTELETPGTMGALTAVAFSPRTTDCEGSSECGVVGGFRQLWSWKDDGTFAPVEVADAARFQFRVRDIAYTPGTTPPEQGTPPLGSAYAITTGCCAASAAENRPALLVQHEKRWYAREAWYGGGTDPGQTSPLAQSVPESLYEVSLSQVTEGNQTWRLSFVAAPGKEPAGEPREPASRVIGRMIAKRPTEGPESGNLPALGAASDAFVEADSNGVLVSTVLNPQVAEIRLVAGDGDAGRPPEAGIRREVPGEYTGPDGAIDWAVGRIPSGQGTAMTTLEMGETLANPLKCPGESGRVLDTTIDCRPDERAADKTHARRFFALPSYGLNDFVMLGTSGGGWAVGEKGAILRLGGDGGATAETAEPNLPKLGRPEAEAAPDTTPWDPFRPVSLTAELGVVPPLATRPVVPLGEPALIPSGVPNPTRAQSQPRELVSAFAMSLDGRQGWAVGADATGARGSATTLYRYDGERWAPCDIKGVRGQLAPDEACESLLPLLETKGDPVRIADVSRVPYENDEDPDNDDRFEAVAVGQSGASSDLVVLRYSGGRWKAVEGPTESVQYHNDVAFTAPDDGWIAGRGNNIPMLHHFDGTKWTNCAGDPGACGLPAGLLPLDFNTRPRLYLSVADERIYLGGNRNSATNPQGGDETAPTFPFVIYKDGDSWTADSGGYDPFRSGASTDQGWLSGLSVARDGDGYAGWALGRFGDGAPAQTAADAVVDTPKPNSDAQRRLGGAAAAAALRLDGAAWERWTAPDALADYFGNALDGVDLVTLPDRGGEAVAIKHSTTDGGMPAPIVRIDPDAEDGWQVVPTPFDASNGGIDTSSAVPQALGAGADGEVWVAALGGGDQASGRRGRDEPVSAFYRLDDEQPRAVFDDIAHPIREDIVDAVGTKDGGVWVATAGNAVYRYDRVTGWDRLLVPGWQASRNSTSQARANAIAVGPDGKGLVVGAGGRIANVGPLGVQLDPAAGTSCAVREGQEPCGTPRDLH